MKNGVQPSSKDVEQQFRELRELLECFDPNLPTFWSSDLPWHYLAMAYEAGALADVLLGIEPQLRSLAERYERNPKAFLPARDDLFRRHAKRLGISWTESESSLSLTEFLEALTTRVRRALVNVAPLIKTILEGGNLPPSAGKEVFGCLRVLTSDSPGRPPKVTERERACDESVLSMSTEQPRIYAESLLKVCELSIESSLPCLSGIAGADLRRRVVSIMRLRAMPLGIAGRVVLTLFGIAAVGGPLALGLIQAQDTGRQMENTASLPSFEVAAIKPSKPDARNHDWDSNEDRVRIEHYSLRDLIAYAYGLKSNSQVLGGPDWIDKRSFDITAKVDQAEVVKIRAMSRQEKGREWHMMMQSLLTNRFGLKVHPGQKSMPVFALVIAKS
ncbi:MAG: TIGR03435 family protein, partial [Alphaproteobacteria bacterium]|nr:TIGR03435 family protein [Alphaproteobacteria bacterium]